MVSERYVIISYSNINTLSTHPLAAAEAGVPLAQYNFGIALYDGKGTKRDTNEAYEWVQKGMLL
jgi:TPR repeat protein